MTRVYNFIYTNDRVILTLSIYRLLLYIYDAKYKLDEAGELHMSKNNILLKYHNDLNQIVLKGLNARESNVFFAICAIMKDHGLESLTLSFNELKKISNITTSDEKELVNIIKTTYQKLINISCYYETDVTFGGFMLFNQFHGNIVSRTVTISVNPKFSYMLNELTKNFTVMQLKEFTKIQSNYAKTLYRQLQQYKTTGVYIVELDKFKNLLNIPDSYDMRKISQKILTPSLKSLTPLFSELAVEKIREGRFVKQLKFTFKPFTTKDTHKMIGISLSAMKENTMQDEMLLNVDKIEVTSEPVESSTSITKKKAAIKNTSHDTILCPACHTPLDIIQYKDTTFYGHKNYKTHHCRLTFSSIDEINAYAKEHIQQAEKQEILQLMKDNQKYMIDAGDYNQLERIVYFNNEDTPRKIPYTKDGVKKLKTYLLTLQKK